MVSRSISLHWATLTRIGINFHIGWFVRKVNWISKYSTHLLAIFQKNVYTLPKYQLLMSNGFERWFVMIVNEPSINYMKYEVVGWLHPNLHNDQIYFRKMVWAIKENVFSYILYGCHKCLAIITPSTSFSGCCVCLG